MPLFEFRCSNCAAKFAQLVRMTADSSDPTCPKCGGRKVSKLISRFSRSRSEEEAADALEEASLAADPDDRGSMRRVLREMGKQVGEDADEDLDAYLEEAERDLCEGEDDASEFGA